MQHIALPDESEIEAQKTTLEFPEPYESGQPFLEEMGYRLMALERWVRALYAKQGEECPLFGEEK